MGISVEEYKKMISNQGYATKNVKRQIQGKINHELGKNFEEQIESICEVYKFNNTAIIEKTPEPLKVLKHIENGHFDAIFVKSAQPDFKGTIKGGQTIVFDAKFTENNKITYQALSDYQRDTLKEYSNMGANAFVLVGFVDGAIYKVDIDTWINMKEIFGRKYISQNELEEKKFRIKNNKSGILDFLN